VRDEVVPFIALLPSHLERDHFEGVVATAFDTTKDAIHMEVQQYIEAKASTRSAPASAHDEVMTQTQANEKEAVGESYESIAAYCVALAEAVPPFEQTRIKQVMGEVFEKPWEDILGLLDTSGVAKNIFEAEQSIARLTNRLRQEHIVHSIKVLHERVIRAALHEAKQQLGEEGEQSGKMERLLILQKRLQKVPLILEDLTPLE